MKECKFYPNLFNRPMRPWVAHKHTDSILRHLASYGVPPKVTLNIEAACRSTPALLCYSVSVGDVTFVLLNMYFHEVKSTAHPPIIGALGHSTDCIVKQWNTTAINIYLHSCKHVVSCWKRNSGLKQKLHVQTIEHTGFRKFKIRPACLLLLLLSVNVCV